MNGLVTIAEIAARVRVLGDDLDGLVVSLDRPTPDPKIPPDKPGLEPVASFMEIETVPAAPGTVANVKVYGGTTSPITGFWANFGHNDSVKLVGAKLGQFFDEFFLSRKTRFDEFKFVARGKINAVFSYMLFRFSPEGVEGFEKAIQIPPGTVLFTMSFQLSAESKGTYLVEHGGTGHGISNRPTLYTSMLDKHGLKPVVANGGIRVATP